MGQLQQDQVELLVNGVLNVMGHLGMLAGGPKSQIPGSKSQAKTKSKKTNAGETPATTEESKVLTKFEWLYTKNAGMWYPKVVAGDVLKKGQEIGSVGDLFGDVLEKIISPVDGVVLFLTINPSVLENGLLMGIGCGSDR